MFAGAGVDDSTSKEPKRRFRTGALDADVSFRRDVEACGAKNASLVSQLSPCLSRACLGKKIVFIYKWRKRRRVSYRGSGRGRGQSAAAEG